MTKPPRNDVMIRAAGSGFCEGVNTIVTIGPKLIVRLPIIWVAAFRR